MKNVIALILLVVSLNGINAQKYVHYYMNDGTFNGFYTDNVSEISHDSNTDNSFISSFTKNGITHNILVQNIDSIVVENALVYGDSNTDYRIYEIEYEDQPFKRVIADTRAHLLASKNGDFGANDTILYISAYNNEKLLLTTDDNGNLMNVFTGTQLFYYDYSEGKLDNIIEITKDGYIERRDMMNEAMRMRKHINAVAPMRCAGQIAGLVVDLGMMAANSGMGKFASNIANAENHNGLLAVDGLLIAGDIAGIIGSVAAIPVSGGLSLITAGLGIASLVNDLGKLLNDLFPDSETIKKYKEYYATKYGINVFSQTAENVTVNSADLKGYLTSSNGRDGESYRGDLYFELTSEDDLDKETYTPRMISANSKKDNNDGFDATGNANNLEIDKWYCYILKYVVKISRFTFEFKSDVSSFRTKAPGTITGEVVKLTEESASVKVSFSDVPSGARCGVKYLETGDLNNNYKYVWGEAKNGEQEINITGLEPIMDYTYCAIIEYDNKNNMGEGKYFTTLPPDLSGTWKCEEKTTDSFGNEKIESYNITLTKGGGVSTTKNDISVLQGSWSVTRLGVKGRVVINIIDFITPTGSYYHGYEWGGVLNDLKNPTSITGSVAGWNYNDVSGYHMGDGYEMTLTK